MIERYSDLTPEALAPLGFEDPAHACYVLREFAGHDIPDGLFEAFLRIVVNALAGCADPDRALGNLARWADVSGSRYSAYAMIASNPEAARILTTVFAASQFFANLIISNPEYVEVLINPRMRDRERDADALWEDLTRRVAVARTPNAKRDALRRFKPLEVLRIGARDILGYANMEQTARAISDFADACVRMAVRICAAEAGVDAPPFAVIAMGKLGGRELNYSSDIDLIFAHEERSGFHPIKFAEAVRDTMARVTEAGFVFRVDLRLRPEGRFGALSRSVESCRAYYESWAEPWERQALLKARCVAGDTAVGEMFIGMAMDFVYPSRVEESFVESIRSNKRRIEEKAARSGDADVNVKEGVGGIRDVEFAVQLMQLVAGGKNPDLRVGSSLEALDCLTRAGLLTVDEHDLLTESYAFLRTVEHRLQIMDELPIRNIPRDAHELDKFGRRLGYANGAEFHADYRRHTERVHALFARLFYGSKQESHALDEIAAWVLAPDDPAALAHLRDELTRLGFQQPETALRMLRQSVVGSEYGGMAPDSSDSFAAVSARLLRAAAETSDPDGALLGLDNLAREVPSRTALFQTLAESDTLLPRLCRLAAEGPAVWQLLLQHMEFFDLLADDEVMDNPSPPPAKLHVNAKALATSLLRARLLCGARDIWEINTVAGTIAELTTVAERALSSALLIASQELGFEGRFAIIGMGKLGGRELGYASDLDVLYVSDSDGVVAATKVAERLQQILRDDIARYGVRFELDARLRPDGRKGQLVLDLATYRRYYAESAATWERQALLKSRPAAGDPTLCAEFASLATQFVYGSPITDEQIEEIRAMKRRIEKERAQGAANLKLSPGGMTDIEWIAQILQLRWGHKKPRLRPSGTLKALLALRDDAKIQQSDWEVLDAAYKELTRLRNRLYLRRGVGSDVLDPMPEATGERMKAVRAICLRLFYEENI
jgi:glutamate-ammonia-ligase adenylyltransferase